MFTGPESPLWRPISAPWPVWLLVLICVGVELLLQASDWGLGPPVLRFWAYELGGFRPLLLTIEEPRFAAQTTTMFLSYTVLHVGLGHLAMNMVTLLSLGAAVVRFAGVFAFCEIFFGAAISGAMLYAFFPGTGVSMVGASAGLFGLAAAILVWEAKARALCQHSLLPVIVAVLVLCLLNVGLWVILDGHVAWQGHLGGFLAGVAFAINIGGDASSAP